MSSIKSVKLNDGTSAPVLGFGTGTAHMLAAGKTGEAVKAALDAGYRNFDFSTMYETARFAGKAIQAWLESGAGKREDLYINMKVGEGMVAPKDFSAKNWVGQALKELQLDHVDCLVIQSADMVHDIPAAWKEMEECQGAGLAKSIGVSNFTSSDLQKVLAMCRIKPAVHQLEIHPYSWSTLKDVRTLCGQNGITFQAVSALVPSHFKPDGPLKEVLPAIAEERGHGETPEDVLLLWAQQVTEGVIYTTSSKPERMAATYKLFENSQGTLNSAQLKAIEDAGAKQPWRQWESQWPYFMKGEGGHNFCDKSLNYFDNQPEWLAGWQQAVRATVA